MFKSLKMFPIVVDIENNNSYMLHIEYLFNGELYHSVIFTDDNETYVMNTYSFAFACLVDIPEEFGENASAVYTGLYSYVDDFLDSFV